MSRTASSIKLMAVTSLVALAVAIPAAAGPQPAAAKEKKPDYPPFKTVMDGFTKVVSTMDGSTPLYELYQNKKTDKLLAVIPGNHEKQLIMIACTVSGGDPQAGVMVTPRIRLSGAACRCVSVTCKSTAAPPSRFRAVFCSLS